MSESAIDIIHGFIQSQVGEPDNTGVMRQQAEQLYDLLCQSHAVVALPDAVGSELGETVWRRDFEDGYGTSGMRGPRSPRVVIDANGYIGLQTVPTTDLRPDVAEFVASALLAASQRKESRES